MKKLTARYEKLLLKRTIAIKRNKIIMAIQKTMVLLYPFALFGTIMSVIRSTFLVKGGIFDTLFKTTSWIPHVHGFNFYVGALSKMSLGMIGLLGAYGVARYLAQAYKRDGQLAGLTGILGFLLYNFSDSSNGLLSFESVGLGFRTLLFGILTGVIVGYLFRWLSKEYQAETEVTTIEVFRRGVAAIWAIVVALIVFSGFNLAFYEVFTKSLNSSVSTWIYSSLSNVHSVLVMTGLQFISSILQFIGLGSQINNTQIVGSDTLANLNYALQHKSAMHVPYPISGHGILGVYTNIGGAGATLGLVIAIILVAHQARHQHVGLHTLVPVFFNQNQALLVGTPVLFNISYIIPFWLAPLINLWIASIALALHIIPAAVYPVPAATPGVLAGFVATSGNFGSLLLSIGLVVIDTLIYIPFVKLSEQLSDAVQEEELNTDEK